MYRVIKASTNTVALENEYWDVIRWLQEQEWERSTAGHYQLSGPQYDEYEDHMENRASELYSQLFRAWEQNPGCVSSKLASTFEDALKEESMLL